MKQFLKTKKFKIGALILIPLIVSLFIIFKKEPKTGIPGVDWNLATKHAAFSPRVGHSSVVFQDKMWVIGGATGEQIEVNDVWSSTDGINWNLETEDAGFLERQSHKSVVFDNKIWVIAGLNSQKSYLSDVWSSADGKTWIEETDKAEFPARHGFGCTVYKDKIWVIAGWTPDFFSNDVWSSEDGHKWDLIKKNAKFTSRTYPTAFILDDKLWISDSAISLKNGLWNTEDGKEWTFHSEREKDTRHGSSYVNFKNDLYMTGGAINVQSKYYNDVWRLKNGESEWQQIRKTSPFAKRYGQTLIVYKNKIWLIGGFSQSTIKIPFTESKIPLKLNVYNDVWHSP